MGQALGDDRAKPKSAGMIESQSLHDLDGLGEALLGLAGELSEMWIAPEDPDVHCSVYVDEQDSAKVLFVGNRSADATLARVNVPADCTLTDLISGQQVASTAGLAELNLAASQVRMFQIGTELTC